MTTQPTVASHYEAIGRFTAEFEWLCDYARMAIMRINGHMANKADFLVELKRLYRRPAAPLFEELEQAVEANIEHWSEDHRKMVENVLSRIGKLRSERNATVHSRWDSSAATVTGLTLGRIRWVVEGDALSTEYSKPSVSDLQDATTECGWLALYVDDLSMAIVAHRPITHWWRWQDAQVVRSGVA